MKKFLLLFLSIIQIFIFTSCNSTAVNTGSKISSPLNSELPISGTWTVTNYEVFDSGINVDDYKKWLNAKASFSSNFATLGATSCNKPVYKIKIVNTNSYLIYSYKLTPDKLKIAEKELKIISISSENNFFHEFIKVDEQHLITNIDGVFLYLKKTSEQNDVAQINNNSTAMSNENTLKSTSSDSGVLLTLRSQNKSQNSTETNEDKEYSYRTLWISYSNKTLSPPIEISTILVPRMTGFWSIQAEQSKDENVTFDSLTSAPVGSKTTKKTTEAYYSKDRKFINFIGNDYISIDRTMSFPAIANADSFSSSSLQMLPIDNLNSRESLKINQLIDKNINSSDSVSAAFKEGAGTYLNSLNNSNLFSKEPKLDNWGVFRRNGHWVLKGRLVSLKTLPTNISPDFFIPFPAPNSLVGYDNLYPNWSSIKESIPDAIDAFSSPKKNLLLSLSNSILSIYEVKNNAIVISPLAQIRLKENETVIMSQWALENYVESWNKAVNKYDVVTPSMIKLN